MLAGRKIWWAWYVNIANQALWVIFALVTGYYAFLVGTAFYLVVFTRNAYLWTKDRPQRDTGPKPPKTGETIGQVLGTEVDDQGMTVSMRIDNDYVRNIFTKDALKGLSIGPGEVVPVINRLGMMAGRDGHFCHEGPSPTFGHALICPTGEHPTGWQHLNSIHYTCPDCGSTPSGQPTRYLDEQKDKDA